MRAWMSAVLTMPGDMQLTVTPRSAHSQPSVCVIFTTAALDALYAICARCPSPRLTKKVMLCVLPCRARCRQCACSAAAGLE